MAAQQVKKRKTIVTEYSAEGEVVRETCVVEVMVVAAPVTWPIASFGGYTASSGGQVAVTSRSTTPPSEPDPESS